MKQQIATRLGVANVRDTMMQFVTGAITREQAKESRRPDATSEMNAHDQKLLKEMLRERANRRIGVGDW